MEKRIRVKDLAPFASIEDLSDERESPLDGDKPKTTLANIEEEAKMSKACPTSSSSTSGTTNNSPAAKMNLNVTSTTPRIDISRASSSSHQDDSSPERELILGQAKDSKLEVVFGEEIASELHSSTEELSFHENEDPDRNRSKKSSSHVVSLTDMQREALRKDSGCSADVAFLSISGRTSRVSSVGSVASGGSGVSNISALSHCSAASCLSAVSNLSRGSSPHRTSVETSFCGKKPVHSASVDDEYAVIVSKQTRSPSISAKTRTSANRATDKPPEAKPQKSQLAAHKGRSKSGRKRPTIENPKTQKFVSLYSDEEDKSAAADATAGKAEAPATQPLPKGAKTLPGLDPRTQVYIPLRADSLEEKMPTSPRKKQLEPTCQPNPFSPKRMKPFTNATLVSFISKYDALKDSPTISLPRRKMYEEFQKFISLRDDDDPAARGRGTRHQSKVERITVPVQVHRSRSLSDNMTCTAVVEDTAQLSKSDTRIPAPTSTPPANQRQSSLRLSDSLLEQRHCDSSEIKLDRCHSALATTASSSFSFSSSVVPSNQSTSQFLQLDHRGTRPAKSMTHLSTSTKYNSSNSPTINVSTCSNTVPDSARSDEYPFRRCSESAKEMRNMDKMKSRSGSIKSLLRTFFKKNGDPKTEKTYHTDSAVEIEPKPIPIPQKSRACSKAESIIIPLHSPDYDYEAAAAAAAVSKKSADDDKKEEATSKAVAVVDPSSREEKEPPDLPPKQVVSKALVHQVSVAETSAATPEASVGLKTSERVESVAKTTVVQCHVPSSPVSSSCVSQQHLPHISQQCSSPKTEAFSGNHVEKFTTKPPNSHGQDSGDVFLPTVESYSSLSSTSKKANEEETDEAMSTDSDKSHPIVHEHDEENKKLVNQEESFEELPYVPTTLPIERSVAIPIIPIKERSSNDMLVHSVERPRSMSCHMTSLNLNPAAAVTTTTTVIDRASTSEKLRITLPRTDAVLSSPKWKRRNSEKCESSSPPPPPLPPRKTTKSASWICFDESRQLENRQSPRRITTLPSSYGTDQTNRSAGVNLTAVTSINVSSSSTSEGAGFTANINQRIVFVNPNECSCECHDVGAANTSSLSRNTIPVRNGNVHH